MEIANGFPIDIQPSRAAISGADGAGRGQVPKQLDVDYLPRCARIAPTAGEGIGMTG